MNPSVSSTIKKVHTSISHIENQISFQIEIKLIHDIQEVEKIWKYFNSHPKNIYQDWNYIKVFYQAYKYTPYFYVAFENDIPVACIPLEWVPERNRLEMFGNRSYIHYLFFTPSKEYIFRYLLQKINLPIYSESIVWESGDIPDFLEAMDTGFILNTKDSINSMDYIHQNYSGHGKKKFISYMRNMTKLGISVEEGKIEDLEWFFKKNQENFGAESAYHDIRRQKNIQLVHDSKEIDSYIKTFCMNGEIVSVRFLIRDPETKILYSINGGTNKDIRNLGKFVTMYAIDLAISLGCTSLNLGPTSFGYKQEWATETHPVYNFKK